MSARGPANHHVLGNSTSTATHLGLCFLVFILSAPIFNPVLVTIEVLGIPPLVVPTAALVFFLHTVANDAATVFFYSMRVFLHSILSIFFRSIEVVGAENIPTKGPVIFTGNHSNQFVDGLQVLCHAQHRVGFLIAEKSWNTPIIGHCAQLCGCMPVKRPQDAAQKGVGVLVGFSEVSAREGGTVTGKGTTFTKQIAKGDKIRRRGGDSAFKVQSVESDTQLTLVPVSKVADASSSSSSSSAAAAADAEANSNAPPVLLPAVTVPSAVDAVMSPSKSGNSNTSEPEEGGKQAQKDSDKGECAFDVLGRVDQGAVFAKVLDFLASGMCLGIFPEGGSSDRSWFTPGELLGLKPGVSIIALEAMRTHKLAVPIVPVGMQYFEGDKYRGRCVIEFGPPIVPAPELHAHYAEDKATGGSGSKATVKLLESIEEGMRGCLIEAPSYEKLETIYMVRRLFARDRKLSATAKQDLNRRFAYWYNEFYLKMKKDGKAIPEDLEKMSDKIRSYMETLRLLGLKDYQVRHLDGGSYGQILATLAHLVLLLALGSVPMLLLNLPVGLFARATADKHMAEALAGSNVKVKARDVRLSKMISVCMAGVPLLWALYAILMLLAGVQLKLVLLYVFWCPFFSYLSVIATEAGMVDLKDLKPHLLQLMVAKGEMVKLMDQRKMLQQEVRRLVKQYGPGMGGAYYDRSVSWNSLASSSKERALSSDKDTASAASASGKAPGVQGEK